jgi:hypothetical protein
MQKKAGITGIFLLAILYFFTTEMAAYSYAQPVSSIDCSSGQENEMFSPAVSISSFYLAPKTESSVNLLNNTLPSVYNNISVSFPAFVQSAGHIFHAGFSQYSFYITNVRIRFRKASIIFPFHNFW